MDDHALRYWVGFNRVNGIGAARFHGLLRYFGDLETAWNAPESELIKAVADQRACNSVIRARRTADLEADLAAVARVGARIVTLQDGDYPDLLRQIDNPPPLLYVRGTLSDSDRGTISIVGTRTPTSYGLQVTRNLSGALSRQGLTIVSGLAKGIDSAAHQTALDSGGRTIAFLGHGIDTIYPNENRALAAQIIEHGALLTEFPIGTPPDGNNFPMRNRLISGLSLGVLIVEARPGSGALGTARHALDQGREVFAVPGSIYAPESQGTNLLIQTGEAKLVGRVEDILGEFNVVQERTERPSEPEATPSAQESKADSESEAETPADFNETEALLIGSLSAEPTYVDELCASSGLPMVQVTSTLTILELRGIVRQVGSMRYVLAR